MRPATAAAGLFGGGVGLVAFLLTAGLPGEMKETGKLLREAVATARAEMASDQQRLDHAVNEHKDFMEPRPEVAAARKAFVDYAGAIEAAEGRITAEVEPLVAADKRGDADKLAILTTEIAVALQVAPGDVDQKLSDVFRVRNYKRDHLALVKGARDVLKQATEVMADATLTAVVEKGQADYPDASEKIQKRLDALLKKAETLANHGAQFDAALQIDPPDYVKVGQLSDFLQLEGRSLINEVAKLRGDVASLGKSTDKILIDMKRDGAACYHKYRYVEGGLARVTSWETVSCVDYDQHAEHLGMALHSKPEGTFESEAVTVAHPPGYSYIGNTRYGHWDTRPDGRFWVWYGQYALTRDLLWGVGGYQPIRHDTYSSYRGSVQARKPYYGAAKEFGSSGSLTQKKYSASSFLTKRRETYAASRFKTSGSSGYRDFKSGSGSGSGGTTRSGGYRTNRYRSSSFGGSGK